MSRYKVLLFDLDGTLMDTAPGIIETIRYTAEKLGLEIKGDLRRFLGPPLSVSMEEFCGLDKDGVREAVRTYREEYPKEQLFNSSVFDGVEGSLAALKADGYRLAVATSKPEVFARKLLERFGVDKYFEYIGGSGIDGARNSKQLVIEYVLENLGQPDRKSVLMIGDRSHDIVGAKECGLDSLYVLWGYGSREEAEECGAGAVVNTPAECRSYIESIV